jgi:hypothetical protein
MQVAERQQFLERLNQETCVDTGRLNSAPSSWKQGRSDAGHRLSEEVAENLERVESALSTGAEQRRQHLLGLCAEPRAIAARDFPIHDGRTNRLLGAPVECRAYCYAGPQQLRPRQSIIVKGFHSA